MLVFEKMALLRYLKRVDGLQDPKGPLTSSISAQAIAEANKEVQKAMGQNSVTGKKRGSYKKYTATQRSEIGKYSCQHGAAATARHFSMKLGSKVSESTVKSIKKAYLEELRKRPRTVENRFQHFQSRSVVGNFCLGTISTRRYRYTYARSEKEEVLSQVESSLQQLEALCSNTTHPCLQSLVAQ